jgi:subtilisin family serine protease
MRAYKKDDWHDRGQFHTHRKDLYTTEDDWPTAQQTLLDAGAPADRLEPPYRSVRYGLVRLSLDVPDGVELERVVGLNYLLGFGMVELDQGVEGQPKIIGSALGDYEPTSEQLPPRIPDGPGTGVTVGVVDTGYRRHRWVRGACTYSADDLEERPAEGLDQIAGHGLFVAGLVLEQAPGATVRMERVLSTDGHAEAIEVHDAICRLAVAGASIINLSLGCFSVDDRPPLVLEHAIQWARTYQVSQGRQPDDIVFVASAGNNGDRPGVDPHRRFWPAALPGVWAVASAEPAANGGAGWGLSGFSARADWVNAAAPGREVLSAWTPWSGPQEGEEQWAYWSGTSFSSGVLSGVLARAFAASSPQERRAFATPGRLPDAALAQASISDGSSKWPVFGADTTRHK